MNLPTLSAADLVRITKAAELAKDRRLFVMLEPDECLALVGWASEQLRREPPNQNTHEQTRHS